MLLPFVFEETTSLSNLRKVASRSGLTDPSQAGPWGYLPPHSTGRGLYRQVRKMNSGPLLKHQKWDLVASGQQQLVSKDGREQWDGAVLHQSPASSHIPMHASAAAVQLHNLYVTS